MTQSIKRRHPSSSRPPELQKHSQPHRPRLHPGSCRIRARPGRPGSVQRAGPGDVRPTQTQVLGRGAETAAHDQESSQGVHPRGPEGNLEPVLTKHIWESEKFNYPIIRLYFQSHRDLTYTRWKKLGLLMVIRNFFVILLISYSEVKFNTLRYKVHSWFSKQQLTNQDHHRFSGCGGTRSSLTECTSTFRSQHGRERAQKLERLKLLQWHDEENMTGRSCDSIKSEKKEIFYHFISCVMKIFSCSRNSCCVHVR